MRLSSVSLVMLVAAVGCSKAAKESTSGGAASGSAAKSGSGAANGSGGHADGSAAGSAGAAGSAAIAASVPLQARDERAKQLLSRGSECELRQGTLPLDCPEYKAIGDHAFQNQNSAEVGETCASFLRDADVKKRLLAANCLDHLNAGAKTPYFAAVLDALEAETDDAVREQIAWGIKGAHAMTSKIDTRVLEVVTKFAADPKRDKAAGYLFWSFFPQYMVGSGPKPSAAAQALAIESLNRDDTACSGLRLIRFRCSTTKRQYAQRWSKRCGLIAKNGATRPKRWRRSKTRVSRTFRKRCNLPSSECWLAISMCVRWSGSIASTNLKPRPEKTFWLH